jgi:hypothetical protein
MLPFPRIQSLSVVAIGILVALTVPSTYLRANEMVQNFGPVGPNQPILVTVGSKRIIAFYEPNSGTCTVHVVVWCPADANAESTVSFKTALNPRQMAHIDTAEHKSLDLQCSDNAKSLAIVDMAKFVPPLSR